MYFTLEQSASIAVICWVLGCKASDITNLPAGYNRYKPKCHLKSHQSISSCKTTSVSKSSKKPKVEPREIEPLICIKNITASYAK